MRAWMSWPWKKSAAFNAKINNFSLLEDYPDNLKAADLMLKLYPKEKKNRKINQKLSVFTKDIFPVFESSTKKQHEWENISWHRQPRRTIVKLIYLSHAGQKLLNADWLRKGAFFFLITRALLVIKSAWLLDADWLSTAALSWFPASNGFWKRISEMHRLSLIYTRLFQLNVKENQHGTKRSLLVEKQNDFSDQKWHWFAAWKKSCSGDIWCCTKHGELKNFMAAKLKVNFFVLLRVALLVLQVTLTA